MSSHDIVDGYGPDHPCVRWRSFLLECCLGDAELVAYR